MTSAMLLEQYLAERHALGYRLKTDEGCLRRFFGIILNPTMEESNLRKSLSWRSLVII